MANKMDSQMVMYEREYREIKLVIAKLQFDSNADCIFLCDQNGQQIVSIGDLRNQHTNIEFEIQNNRTIKEYFEDLNKGNNPKPIIKDNEKENIFFCFIKKRIILIALFNNFQINEDTELYIKKATIELEQIFDAIEEKIEFEKNSNDDPPNNSGGSNSSPISSVDFIN